MAKLLVPIVVMLGVKRMPLEDGGTHFSKKHLFARATPTVTQS
jgi:hypothetical protein